MKRNLEDIPPGYALTITSWENDGDAYKDQHIYGLAYEDTLFLIDLAKLFRSMSRHDGGFGGGSWHWKPKGQYYRDVFDAVDAVVKKYESINVSSELYSKWVFDRKIIDENDESISDEEYEEWFEESLEPNYDYIEMIETLVGSPVEEMYQTDGYIRVFDHFTVHYYQAVVSDVTADFMS